MYTYNLGQKFKKSALEFSNCTAIISEEGILSYAELDVRTDAIAAQLLAFGLKQGDVICISGRKSLLSVACIIASIKAGITYSVFDPDSPVSRLLKIFEKCSPQLVLANDAMTEKLVAAGVNAIDCCKFTTPLAADVSSVINSAMSNVTGSSAAYIMFTSGSTGIPKGAVMTHRNVLNLIEWSVATYGFEQSDVLTSINPLFFDNSVFDIFSSLFTGASLVLFDEKVVRDPVKLLELLDRHQCTSWFSVPSMLIYLQNLRVFRPDGLKFLNRIIFGGEGYPKAKLKQLFDLYSRRIKFYNVYGPTECTCICSSYEASEDDFSDLKGFLPLGKLAANFQAFILDDNLKPVKPGEFGELVLGGPNVGLGYIRDAERTAHSFIQNPINDAFREIVYRTGDIVLYDQSVQKILIMGRADNQIKHMGYRIELEEIENALCCIEGVEQGAVIHCEIRQLSHLVAFVKLKDKSLTEELLRSELNRWIPNYMIPTRFQIIQQLPKNANGKLDRKQLKASYLEQGLHG